MLTTYIMEKIKGYFVAFILVFSSNTSFAFADEVGTGNLIIQPENRTAGERVTSIQFPSGARIKYEYANGTDKKLVAKIFENFSTLDVQKKKIKVSQQKQEDQFHLTVLKEFSGPKFSRPFREILEEAYPGDDTAQLKQAYLVYFWAQQLHNTYKFMIQDDTDQRPGFDEFQDLAINIKQPFEFENTTQDPTHDVDWLLHQAAKTFVAADEQISKYRNFTITADSEWEKVSSLHHDLTIMSEKMNVCNRWLGRIFETKLSQGDFYSDSDATQKIRKNRSTWQYGMLPPRHSFLANRQRIGVSSPMFLGIEFANSYLHKVFTSAAEIRTTYFNDPNFNIEKNLGSKENFPWYLFALAHELGHTLDQNNLSEDQSLYNLVYLASFLRQRYTTKSEYAIDDRFYEELKVQIDGLSTDRMERAATYFALDALVTCI